MSQCTLVNRSPRVKISARGIEGRPFDKKVTHGMSRYPRCPPMLSPHWTISAAASEIIESRRVNCASGRMRGAEHSPAQQRRSSSFTGGSDVTAIPPAPSAAGNSDHPSSKSSGYHFNGVRCHFSHGRCWAGRVLALRGADAGRLDNHLWDRVHYAKLASPERPN